MINLKCLKSTCKKPSERHSLDMAALNASFFFVKFALYLRTQNRTENPVLEKFGTGTQTRTQILEPKPESEPKFSKEPNLEPNRSFGSQLWKIDKSNKKKYEGKKAHAEDRTQTLT